MNNVIIGTVSMVPQVNAYYFVLMKSLLYNTEKDNLLTVKKMRKCFIILDAIIMQWLLKCGMNY